MENKRLIFTNVNPYSKDNIPSPTEKDAGRVLTWGDKNDYPNFLWDCYLNSATLQSSINTIVDFICGNGVKTDIERPNKYESWEEFIRKIALSKMIYGGFAIQVIKNVIGKVAELYCLDMNKVRLSKDNKSILFCDKWTGWTNKAQVFPVYSSEEVNSIYFSKGQITKGRYPIPIWNSAVNAAVTEKKIGEYHLNAIANGFSSSYIINFNNGQPTPEQKSEIEHSLNEKFCGSENAGRLAVAFNDSKDSAVTVEKLDADSFDKKYDALKSSVEKTILQSIRINPVLLGYNANSGLGETEYNSIYKLFNRTTVYPIQKQIITTINQLSDWKISIVPFNIDLLKEE